MSRVGYTSLIIYFRFFEVLNVAFGVHFQGFILTNSIYTQKNIGVILLKKINKSLPL